MASRVVHVRNVGEDGREELTRFASQFGTVKNMVFLPKFSQALVEMDSPDSSASLIAFVSSNPTTIRGKEISVSFSKSQQINTASSKPTTPNRVLLFSIVNPMFNITVDVMHTITSPFGVVQRIVIFNKNSLQVLVEFATTHAAAAAKSALEGKDIYPGSCTLRIEYSHTERLNVVVNNDKTRDYTNPMLPSVAASAPQPSLAMLNAAGSGGQMMYPMDPASIASAQAAMEFYRSLMAVAGGNPAAAMAAAAAAAATGVAPTPPRSQPRFGSSSARHSMPPPAHSGSSPVIMAYGMADQFTCDRIFNLFSLFGRVVKVKQLLSKRGSGMVQMEDAIQAQTVISALNMQTIFGQQLQLQPSKHPSISDSARTDFPNNPSKEYIGSPLNRFNRNTRELVSISESVVYGTAASSDGKAIRAFLVSCGAPDPVSVTDAGSGDGEDASSGLIVFRDTSAALEAVAIANNGAITGEHILKLTFA